MSIKVRRSFGLTGENFRRFALMSRSAQRRRMALSSPRLFKPSFGSVILPWPSARARPAGGLAHACHDRPVRRIHALFDAIARAADQRERKGNDRHDVQLLISQIKRHPSPAGGQLQGKNARTRHGEMAFSANQWLPGTE